MKTADLVNVLQSNKRKDSGGGGKELLHKACLSAEKVNNRI